MATGAVETPISLGDHRTADPSTDTSKSIKSEATMTALSPSAGATAITTSKAMELDELSPAAEAKTSESLVPAEAVSSPQKENEKPAIKAASAAAGASPPSTINATTTSPAGLAPSQVHESAIRSATDLPLTEPLAATVSTTGQFLIITLLLHTGARHPYTISEKYLEKRNVSVTDHNPLNMSVYTLKELIWRDWLDEWEPRPSNPHSIRLIHFGKLLDDKSQLKDGRFALGSTPHVVHMTIKPQEVVDDEDARVAKGMPRERENGDRSPGCRCVIL